MSISKFSLLPLLLLLASCGDNSQQKSEIPDAASVVEVSAPSTDQTFGSFGIDLAARDKTIRPGSDFFRYANGTWLDENEIPADRTSTSMSLIVHERAQERVLSIIEELSAKSGTHGSTEQKVGDYYVSWMDTDALNQKGVSPLKPDLGRIRNLEDVSDLTAEFGRLHYVNGMSPIIHSIRVNPENPDQYIANISLGGIGLPDRDYYLEDSKRFKDIRESYLEHIAEMLSLTGYEDSKKGAEEILALETRIAEHQWVRADRRDRDKTHNPMTVNELKDCYPGFDWDLFLRSGTYSDLTELNVSHPDVITQLIELVNTTPLETWQVYLTYHMTSNNASTLSEAFDDANFRFWGEVLRGQEKQLGRWKRGVSRVGAKNGLGEALGQIYVKRYFPESSKLQMQTLVENLRSAYGERIDALEWMSDETKIEARAKLAAFRAKIGYPDQWQDLDSIQIHKGDLFGNTRAIRKFFEDYDVARINKPTDREEWFMTPQTVNAYYMPPFNEIVFPAAILEPPFFDPNADDAVNYGAIGATIGHEMGHGFDDQGSKSDAKGVKRNWWTQEDRVAFESLTGRLGDQFSQYEAVPGTFIDGKFTMGENIGDLGGLVVAYRAYKLSLQGKEAPILEGLTGDQRFFLAYAQSWRSKQREEALVQRLKSDPHSPPYFRVNGVVRNVVEWYSAFDVTEEDALYLPPEERVSIW